MNNMTDLGLYYVKDTSDYDVLRAQIYEYYGAAGILGGGVNDRFAPVDFPEPLDLCRGGSPPVKATATNPPPDKAQFFRHLLHADAGALMPFVDAVLAAEYKNSPIFAASANFSIDRETLAQIVDRAFRLARARGGDTGPHVKALLNALVLARLLM